MHGLLNVDREVNLKATEARILSRLLQCETYFNRLKGYNTSCSTYEEIVQTSRTAVCQTPNSDISTELILDSRCQFSEGIGSGVFMGPDDNTQQEPSLYYTNGSGSPDPSIQQEPTSRTIALSASWRGTRTILSRLYPNYRLGCLLQYCFDELESYYPCIDRIDFYERLSLFFVDYCSCKDRSTLIPEQPEHLVLAALTCQMLAIATYIGGNPEPNQERIIDDPYMEESWQWYVEGRRLLAHSRWQEKPTLDVLRLHILEVVYGSMLERKKAMSNAISVAVGLAFVLQLHNEELWGCYTPREKEYRRLLWWTVYGLDRRMAFRIGRPYLIRDSEFAVAEFTTVSWNCYLFDSIAVITPENETRTIPLQWPQPSRATENWFKFLQFHIQWSKMATMVWDSLCSLRRPKSADLHAVNVTDALISNLRMTLPITLQWDPNGLPSLVYPGEMDRSLRLRLIVFEACTPV